MRFLKDHLFTENFLIKGHVKTGKYRLSTFLNKTHKQFLEMEEATLIRHDGSEKVHVAGMEVRIHDILFAYESEDTGDDVLKGLAERARDEIRITAYFSCSTPLEISGKVLKRIFDARENRQNEFIVVVEPELQTPIDNCAPEYDTIRNMSYAIINKDRISFLFR